MQPPSNGPGPETILAVGETILVLDDDSDSCKVLAAVLGDKAGYAVLAADSPDAALTICRGHRGPVALLVADVILRHADGNEIARYIHELHPAMPVLYISGYPLETLLYRGLLEEEPFHQRKAFFLQKPFTPGALIQTVRAIIEGTASVLNCSK